MPAPQNEPSSPLSQLGEDSLIDLIDQGFGQAVRDIWDFGTDLPSVVAREQPESPPLAAIKPVLRLACRQYARGGGPRNLPGFDAAWGGLCNPYLDGIGETPIPGSLARPFTGGQCTFRYFVTAKWRSRNTDGSLGEQRQENVTGTLGRPGPIRGIERRGGTGSWQMVLLHGTDNVFTSPESVVRSSSSVNSSFEELSIVSVAPVSGQADSCGSPAPVYNPPRVRPGLPTLPPSTPVDFPGIGPIGVDVTFDPDGTVNVNLPDIGVNVGIEDPFGLGGDGDGGAPPSGPPPGDVGSPGAPVGIGAGEDGEGVAPEGSVLVGLRVQVVTTPQSRNRYTDEVLRGAYYVYMGVPGLLDHDPAGAMVRVDQFIFAEQPNLTAWRIRANTGYELITTPYYRQVEA